MNNLNVAALESGGVSRHRSTQYGEGTPLTMNQDPKAKSESGEPHLTTVGPWHRLEAVPDEHFAIIPNSQHAGILYSDEGEARAFLWADDGVTLPGWALDIVMVQVHRIEEPTLPSVKEDPKAHTDRGTE